MSPADRRRAASRDRIIAGLRSHFASAPPTASRVLLFGSIARGDFDAASDADILVLGPAPPDEGLCRAAGRDVDVVAWETESWRQALSDGHPFALAVEADAVELWRAPGPPAATP